MTAVSAPPVDGVGVVAPRRAVGSAGVLVASKGAALLLQVVQLAILARALDRPLFGSFAAGFALVTIVGAIAEAGLLNATVLSLADDPEPARVLPAARAATVRVVGVAALVAIGLGLVVLRGDARAAALALVPWLVLSRIDMPLIAHHQARFGGGRLAVAEVTSRALLVASAVPVALVASTWSPLAVLALIGAGFAASEVPSLLILAAGAPWRGRPEALATRRLARRALPLGITNAGSLVHARGDQVMLDALGRRSGLAAYALAYRVNDAVLALVHAAGMVSFPALAQVDETQRARLGRRLIGLGCALGLAIGAGALVVGPTLVVWLGGAKYDDAGPLVRMLAAALGASVANLPVAQLVIVAGRVTRLLWLTLAAVVVNLLLNAALIPGFGARGSAAATITTETLGLLCVAAVAHRAVPGSVPWLAVAAIPCAVVIAASVGWLA
jgi:O-antigen/teichoic acid export membrane protein